MHILLASFATFMIMNSDDVIIGKFLSTYELGLYSIAHTIASFSSSHIIQLINMIIFPTYSKMQNKTTLLNDTFLKTLDYVTAFTISAAFGIFLLSGEIISIFLGNKWMDAILTLQVLAFACSLDAISSRYNSLFQSIGHLHIV